MENMKKIKIKINGQEKELPDNTTIKEILNLMKIKNNMLVVEKNIEIIDKKDYESICVKEGDNIEIAGFFGGG